MKKFLSIFLLFSLVVIPTSFGIPGIPHQFYGSVSINGKPASDGAIVSAKIDGVEVARTYVKNGKYGYNPIFYIEDPENEMSGKEVKFFINGVFTGKTKFFCNGCVTLLDLSINVEKSSLEENKGGGPSSSSIGSTLATQPLEEENRAKSEEEKENLCEERWVCSEWSSCVEGIQKRSCEDVNECGTEVNKPLETQPCSKELREKASLGIPIGFFLISNKGFIFGLILSSLLLIFFVGMRKIKK